MLIYVYIHNIHIYNINTYTQTYIYTYIYICMYMCMSVVSLSELFDLLVGWLACCLAGLLVCWLAGWLVGLRAGGLACWLVCWLAGLLVRFRYSLIGICIVASAGNVDQHLGPRSLLFGCWSGIM